jgi:hypothetical protein
MDERANSLWGYNGLIYRGKTSSIVRPQSIASRVALPLVDFLGV